MSVTRGLPIGPPPKEAPQLQSLSSDGPFFRPPRQSRARRDKRSGMRSVFVAIQISAAVCAATVMAAGKRS